MFKNLRKTLVVIAASLTLAVVPALAVSAVASAQDINIGDCLQQGSNLETGTENGCNPGGDESGSTEIQGIVDTIINIFSVVVGIVAVIMIIVGGFKYITSGGDSGNITGAKNTIVYAVIGLVIVALAQFIVKFVLERVNTGA